MWWPLAAPYGCLLTAIAAFLFISGRFSSMVGLRVVSTADVTVPEERLAVLRLHAKLSATLSYAYAEPYQRGSGCCRREEIGPKPIPPLPRELRELSSKWRLVNDERDMVLRSAPRAFFGTRSEAAPAERLVSHDDLPPLLLAEEYRPSLDRERLAAALRNAASVGRASRLVLIEADDDAPLEAIVTSVDVCRGLGLLPILDLH